MTIVIRIDTDNAAFEDPYRDQEVGRILHELADEIEHNGLDIEGSPLRDSNGNTVGSVVIEEVEEVDETTYVIKRFYHDDRPAEIVARGQSLAQAQEHCGATTQAATVGSTATTPSRTPHPYVGRS